MSPATKVQAGITIRPLLADDEPSVVKLLRNTLGGGPTGDYNTAFFAWKHRQNPFGRSPGLVAEHEGRLVAVRLFLRWKLEASGRPVQAVRAVDTATAPDHQGQGLFRLLTLDLLRGLESVGEVDLVFNTPNGNSRPGYLKMGWQPVGTLPVRLGVSHPIRFFRGARGADNITATATRGAVTERQPLRLLPRCSFDVAAAVLRDRRDDIEHLLEDSGHVHRLHTPISLPYLVWRYGEAPGLDYRCLTVETAGRVTGIAFGRLRHRGPLTEFTLSDLLVRDGDTRTARKLLQLARRSGADHVAVHTAHGTTADRVAGGVGYLRLPRRGLPLVVNPRRETPADPLQVTSWQLSLGDLEVF